MTQPRILSLVLVIIGALLSGNDANAQAHQPAPPEIQTDQAVAMGAWLERLVGDFKLDGAFTEGDCSGDSSCAGISGRMNCIAVGNGPGVQCIINAQWTLYAGFPPIDLSSFLDPAMSLFGVDPGKSEISLMLVNDKGVSTHGFGTVKGSTTAFRTRCAGANDEGCQVGIRIEAGPDANINYLWIGNNIAISMRRVAPGRTAALSDRMKEVVSEESEEEIAKAQEDAREERETLTLSQSVQPTTALKNSGKQVPTLDELDEVVAESEIERKRQARLPRRIADPDAVTVSRNSTVAGNGSVRVRMQPYIPQRELRLRMSEARNLAADANPHLELQGDRITTDNGLRIRSVTLEFMAAREEADGLPAVIPINATTSLFNFDYVRLRNSTQPLMTTLRNVMDPETRRCSSTLRLGDGGDDYPNRFVLVADRFGDCNRTVDSREGDLVFADAFPPRLRQELRELYDPVYSRFSTKLGSEPGVVFVIWRPESQRNDFRLIRSLNRTSILIFNGTSWEHGFNASQRDALWEDIAQEQIARRIRSGDVISESASDYLLKLARAERQQTTSRWLSDEVPEWIAGCGRAMSLATRTANAPRGILSHDCGLVVQFVYDAVERAKSDGDESVMRTWRILLADAYRRKQEGVSSSNFLDSSADARRIVQGLLTGAMDWTAFAANLGQIGVQMRLTSGQFAPSVQIHSLAAFRD